MYSFYHITKWEMIKLHNESILKYKAHQILKLIYFLTCHAVAFAQFIEARSLVENEDAVRAAPTGDAPTASEWSTISLPAELRHVLEVWRYSPFARSRFAISQMLCRTTYQYCVSVKICLVLNIQWQNLFTRILKRYSLSYFFKFIALLYI